MTDTRRLLDASDQSDGFTFVLVGLVGLADAVAELVHPIPSTPAVTATETSEHEHDVDSFDLAMLGLWWLGSTLRDIALPALDEAPLPAVDTGPLDLLPRDLLR